MTFKQKVKNSFRKARRDIDGLKFSYKVLNRDANLLKRNTNEWILYLVRENSSLKEQIEQLEKKLLEFETVKSLRF